MPNSIPTKQELIKILQDVGVILKKVSENNDHTIKQTENLKIILLNLKIQSAHVNQPNGISPIASELRKIIGELNDKTKKTVMDSRNILEKSLYTIQNYAMNLED
jgi:hypothetical protein